MARRGIIRQHVEPAPLPPPAPPLRPLRPPPPKRGGIYAGEPPVHGVDYEEDGHRLSQNVQHDEVAYEVRNAIKQHCTWLQTRGNFLTEDVFISYKDEGRTVTVAPDVMLSKGPAPQSGPTSARAGEGPPAPLFRRTERKSYELAEEGRPPDFVLEVVSPKNTAADLRDKKAKYLKIGIPEYFVFDPHPRGDDPPLKRYRPQHGGKDWEKETSWTGLRSKELGTEILVNGPALEVIDPTTGQPYEKSDKLLTTARREAAARKQEAAARKQAEAKAAEEAAARKQAERELRELRSRLRSRERRTPRGARALTTVSRHSAAARRMEPPDVEAGHADAWSRPVALPDRPRLTVGYEAGRGRSNHGERMLARGPRDLVIDELQANGYTIDSARPRGRRSTPPPGR